MCGGCDGFPNCRLPKGKCNQLQRAPTPRWNADFAAAVEIYYKAIRLSGCDMNGIPQLTMLQTVLDHSDYEIEDDTAFFEYIDALHNMAILSRKR